MARRRHPWTLLASILLLVGDAARAEPTPARAPTSAPASAPALSAQHPIPFSALKVVTPRNKLPPLRSVRFRDKREELDRDRSGTISVTINSAPKGASVSYGGKVLGATPLSLTAPKGSTPFDVVLRARGFMTLRTRIQRKESRTYFFKLTPAKLR